MQTLALSMITKNEPIDRLVMLIDYLRPIASQFIIGDTGSQSFEQDKPLLEKAGATVFQMEWRDDFAWARNQTLEHITTDWVLALDGDELPSYDMTKHIEQAIASDANYPLGYLYFTRNYWGGDWGPEQESDWHCRLFRKGHGSWYRKVHELVQLDGKNEDKTRNTHLLVKAPYEARLIHSKPREMINLSAELYNRLAS